MCIEKTTKQRLRMLLEAGGIFLWLTNLSGTDAYFSVYVICAMAGLACMGDNYRSWTTRQSHSSGSMWLLAGLLSGASLLANYPLFQMVRDVNSVSLETSRIMGMLEAGVSFLGGSVLFYHILLCACGRVASGLYRQAPRFDGKRPVKFFFFCFGTIALINLIYLFFVVYPGSISHDPMGQIEQMVSGQFNNFLPYWYTRILQGILALGYGLFGEVNRAAAFYCVIQLLCMDAAISWAMMTLYEQKVPKFWLAISFLAYAFLPYHIAYSASIWKDVLFGGGILVVITAQYRILKRMGSQKINYSLLFVGGALVSVMRTNGWYVMLACCIGLLVFYRKLAKGICWCMLAVVAFGWFLNVPMLKILNVSGVDYVETLSLPIQQIARCIVNEREISPEDQTLLDGTVDFEEVPELYQEWTSDPLKDEIRRTNHYFIQNHKQEFLSLWLRLGMQYPKDYLEAWVELTKGYWNGGYEYYVYAEYVADNPYGLAMIKNMNPIRKLVKAAFTFTRESILFEPLLSIGLQVWGMLILWYVSSREKRGARILFLPLIVIMVGLWFGAPVFCEFRYTYPVFISMPLLAPLTLDGGSEEQKAQ